MISHTYCKLSRITGSIIRGLIKPPKTLNIAKSNVVKTFDHLRDCPQMSRRYLNEIDAVLQFRRDIVCGLLEDLHRFADGLLPRFA